MKRVERIKGNPKKLAKYLGSDSYKERALSAYYLGELNAQEFKEDLVHQLSDPVPVVVKSVANALEKLDITESIKNLIQERLQEIQEEEKKLKFKLSEEWKPISEEEKEEQLLQYASESHLRENRRKELGQYGNSSKNWHIASVTLLMIALIYYLLHLL